MADSRILHKRSSFGERVISLSHLEYRVWAQYVLSADDYGVMRATVAILQADNPRLEREPVEVIQEAMSAILNSTLVHAFTHQGRVFWWQTDWQDFQQIRYPRATNCPAPPVQALSLGTFATRKLFKNHPEVLRRRSRNVSEIDQTPARTGALETLTLTQTQTQTLTPALWEEPAKSESKSEQREETRQRFLTFWSHYPRKVNKADAEKAFRALSPDVELFASMLEALTRQCRQPDWVKDNGQYVPYAGSWLRAKRWEDEPPVTARPRSLGPAYNAPDWQEECREFHEGRCGNRTFHDAKMAEEKAAS